MAEHQIKMKKDKPSKQRYYPNKPKIQAEINAKVDELLQMGFIEHSQGRTRETGTRIHWPYTGVSYPGHGTTFTQQPI